MSKAVAATVKKSNELVQSTDYSHTIRPEDAINLIPPHFTIRYDATEIQ